MTAPILTGLSATVTTFTAPGQQSVVTPQMNLTPADTFLGVATDPAGVQETITLVRAAETVILTTDPTKLVGGAALPGYIVFELGAGAPASVAVNPTGSGWIVTST